MEQDRPDERQERAIAIYCPGMTTGVGEGPSGVSQQILTQLGPRRSPLAVPFLKPLSGINVASFQTQPKHAIS